MMNEMARIFVIQGQLLTIIKKRSILDVAAALDPPLYIDDTIYSLEKRIFRLTTVRIIHAMITMK